jgi:hypothetical protein
VLTFSFAFVVNRSGSSVLASAAGSDVTAKRLGEEKAPRYHVVMGFSAPDAAKAAADAARTDQALTEARAAADSVATVFSNDSVGGALEPTVSVRLTVGAEDQPMFVFELLVNLDDDLDVDEYPAHEIGELQDDLRRRIAASEVDGWDWIVTTGTKAGAAAG